MSQLLTTVAFCSRIGEAGLQECGASDHARNTLATVREVVPLILRTACRVSYKVNEFCLVSALYE